MNESLQGKRIAYLTAGAAGMYCGSCMRDNALAAELIRQGVDITLLPLYTPIRTDEESVAVEKVFFGGLNVFLQQKVPLFRHLPGFLDRWLDRPSVIKRLTSKAVEVAPKELGALTLSMVKGESGFQRKEVRRLVEFLRDEVRPDLICLTNLLVGGSIPAIKRALPGVPILVTLQGDDVFLDELIEPFQSQVITEMKALAKEADGFITFTDHYANVMSEMMEIPREKFHLAVLGLDTAPFAGFSVSPSSRQTIGYFARLSPEKGFDLMVDAFLQLHQRGKGPRLIAGGWLSAKDRNFFEQQQQRIRAAGLDASFDYLGSPDLEEKLQFFRDIDVFSVPARFTEPKGLYALEAMAAGVAIVEPDHGAFPEMIAASGGGSTFERGNADALADALARYLEDPTLRISHATQGQQWVLNQSDRRAMADSSSAIFASFLKRAG